MSPSFFSITNNTLFTCRTRCTISYTVMLTNSFTRLTIFSREFLAISFSCQHPFLSWAAWEVLWTARCSVQAVHLHSLTRFKASAIDIILIHERVTLATTLLALAILWATLTFDLAFRWAFRWAKVRSKYRLKSKSKMISLSERFRPNLQSKYILRPKLSWTLV